MKQTFNEQCLFMGLRWTKKWKTILKSHSSCIICAHISLATHISHNYYGARNTLKWSFPIIIWVRDGLAQHMVGCYAKPLSWGMVSSILTLLVSREYWVRWCIIGALNPNCIGIKIVQFWFVVYLKLTPHPPVFKGSFHS